MNAQTTISLNTKCKIILNSSIQTNHGKSTQNDDIEFGHFSKPQDINETYNIYHE